MGFELMPFYHFYNLIDIFFDILLYLLLRIREQLIFGVLGDFAKVCEVLPSFAKFCLLAPERAPEPAPPPRRRP